MPARRATGGPTGVAQGIPAGIRWAAQRALPKEFPQEYVSSVGSVCIGRGRGGFDTSSVTIMSYMFSGCSRLVTIETSDRFVTTAVTSGENIFKDCNSLVGGVGTSWNASNPTDKTYAHIDGGGDPGYFTAKTPSP